jgi:glycosyltransferase involved in cell wall biosynthesis
MRLVAGSKSAPRDNVASSDSKAAAPRAGSGPRALASGQAAPRRLLSIGHSYVVRLNRRLAHELSSAGGGRWEVTAAAPAYFHGGSDLRPINFEPNENEPCRVAVLPARMTRFVHVFTYGGGLRSLLREGWDLVHAWEEPYILAGGQIALHTPHDTQLVFRTAQSFNKWYPPPFNWVERRSMNRAAGWICSAQTVYGALKDRKPYDRKPVRQIPLGVDTEVFHPDRSAGCDIRRRLGFESDGPPVIGYLGRFAQQKGIGVLMRALDAVKIPWRAMLVGAGAMEREVRAWAAQYPEQVRVCTDVRHDDVPQYLNAMDMLTAPSLTTPRWREQFGRMTIEAFACGVPMVGSDSGEIPHVIGDAGVVVREGNVDAWTDALSSLLESPTRRTELAQAGLERAATQYAWPIVARQYLKFFEEIVASRTLA